MKGRAPTKEEKKWLDAVCEIGCIVCINEHNVYSPAVPHHLDGKTKPGAHFATIPLCGRHHQTGGCGGNCVARHQNKFQFEKMYGNEAELLEQTRRMVNGQM